MFLVSLGDINMDGYYGNAQNCFINWTNNFFNFSLNYAAAHHFWIILFYKSNIEKMWKAIKNNHCFVDLAVSAPYDGTDQGGAIYIFHGSEDGLRTKVSQVILAKLMQTS